MVEGLAAGLYLLNKIFFLCRELADRQKNHAAVRRWKIYAWSAGLLGLPFVSWILLNEQDWIFGCLELGVAPSMIVGLHLAVRNRQGKVPKWVDWIVYTAIVVGVILSYRALGGLDYLNQYLELTAVATFIPGTYLLGPKDSRNGYLFYLPMFAATGTLLFRQEHYWFAAQQVVSAVVILAAYFLAGRRAK